MVIGFWNQKRWPILKMTMEHTNPIPSKKFVTPSLTMFSPLDALLLLMTAFSITCIVAKRNPRLCLLKPFSLAPRKHCVQLNFWIIVMRRSLITTRPRFCFSFLSYIHIQDYIQHGLSGFDSESMEDLKNFSRPTTLIKSKNPLVVEAKPLVATNPPSLCDTTGNTAPPSNSCCSNN